MTNLRLDVVENNASTSDSTAPIVNASEEDQKNGCTTTISTKVTNDSGFSGLYPMIENINKQLDVRCEELSNKLDKVDEQCCGLVKGVSEKVKEVKEHSEGLAKELSENVSLVHEHCKGLDKTVSEKLPEQFKEYCNVLNEELTQKFNSKVDERCNDLNKELQTLSEKTATINDNLLKEIDNKIKEQTKQTAMDNQKVEEKLESQIIQITTTNWLLKAIAGLLFVLIILQMFTIFSSNNPFSGTSLSVNTFSTTKKEPVSVSIKQLGKDLNIMGAEEKLLSFLSKYSNDKEFIKSHSSSEASLNVIFTKVGSRRLTESFPFYQWNTLKESLTNKAPVLFVYVHTTFGVEATSLNDLNEFNTEHGIANYMTECEFDLENSIFKEVKSSNFRKTINDLLFQTLQ
ncbi:hypothetical protein ABK040_014590 [Willaertia magna]